MNQISPEFLEKARQAFKNRVGISLLDVRTAVAALPASTKRRDALSALDGLRKLFKRDLAAVPANWIALRTLFQSQNAAQLGVSAKRLANIRSEVTKAVSAYGAGSPALTKRIPLERDWAALLESAPTKGYGHALNRLACFCSAMGVSPDLVNSQTLLAFHEALVTEEVVKNPRKILQFTISHWNMSRSRVQGWPNYKLSSPFPSTRYALSLAEFTPSFQQDIAKWRRRLLESHVLDDDGPDVPLRSITVDNQEKQLRRFATALITRGFKTKDEITSLSVLLEIATFKEGLRFFLKRARDEPSPYIRKIAWLLFSIARHHSKLPANGISELRSVLKKLGRSEIGMTNKNRELLTQFDEHENVLKLLRFPDEERKRGLKIANPYRRAKAFERALAAAILIYASVRMQNLRTIRMDTNIRYRLDVCILSFEKHETKNRRSLELELPEGVTALLKEYLKEHRKQLPGSSGPYLFPGREGGPRSHNTMREDFKKTMLKQTGLRVNPHLMRHATATLAINEDPANLAIVAQRLGHRLETTRAFYLGNKSRPSSRVLNGILDDLKNKKIGGSRNWKR